MKWCLTLIFFQFVASADAQDWFFDLDKARQVAGETDRLLVIVQFDADFLSSAKDSAEWSNYCHHSISNESREWISKHVVLAAQNIGHPGNLQVSRRREPPPSTDNATPSIGNSITWICQPTGTVVFCLPGYPQATRLHQYLKSIHELKTSTSFDDIVLARWHRQSIELEDREFFESLWQHATSGSGHKKDKQDSSIDLAIRTVVQARRQRLEQRFGSNWDNTKLDDFVTSLGSFAAFESQFMHCLFALHPDETVASFQIPAWQHLANTRLWQGDRGKIAQWVEDQRKQKRPLLLRVEEASRSTRSWPPRQPEQLAELLPEFSVLNASLDDLAVAIDYLEAEPFSIPPKQRPAFLIATSKGDVCKLLTDRDSSQVLADTLVPVFEREEYRR